MNLDFPDWVAHQVQEIDKFSNIIAEIEQDREAISLGKVNYALATYAKYFAVQTGFYLIFKNRKKNIDRVSKKMFDDLYMEAKRAATNPDTEIGKRYIKKAATIEEIKLEMKSLAGWAEYEKLEFESEDLEMKQRAQDRFLTIIDKLDTILQSLKKNSEKEIKYLYLE